MYEERQPSQQYNRIDLSEYQGPDMYIMEAFKKCQFLLPNHQPNGIEGLDGTFKIGGVLRDKSQYRELAVSYITDSKLAKEPHDFEARLYDFNNLSPKQKSYKLRSMNRLRGRIVSSMHWDGYDFVIFRSRWSAAQDAPEDYWNLFDFDAFYGTLNHGSVYVGGEASSAGNGPDESTSTISPRDTSRPDYMDGNGSPQNTLSQQSVIPLSDFRQPAPNHDIDRYPDPVASPLSHHSPLTKPLSTSSLDQHAPSTSAPRFTSAGTPRTPEYGIRHELQSDVNQSSEHLVSEYPEPTPDPLGHPRSYFCGRDGCPTFNNRRALERHLKTTPAHSQSLWRCPCGHESRRKDNFRIHLNKKQACEAAGPHEYVCACGHFKVDSREHDSITTFKDHFERCGRGRKGRRRKAS
ncbi:hypothetical protein GQX73_g9210 [Xylaria multiplex]|uniref:Uncharacterized protein n=1 Tax=Xylaria multiplex TaxID=323545 RepID=A0A7C8MSC3_9PEZI|nr:hypothetical protein GQX73_g9210 [Xylaria multiplex]